jgi:hypothetical protein
MSVTDEEFIAQMDRVTDLVARLTATLRAGGEFDAETPDELDGMAAGLLKLAALVPNDLRAHKTRKLAATCAEMAAEMRSA